MNTIQKRFALFLFGCIPARLLFTYAAYIASPEVLKVLAFVAVMIASGFLYLYVSGTRKTGMETFGQSIWWNHLRPIHAFFYFVFAFFAYQGKRNAYLYLLLDTIFGLTSFLVFHFSQGDFLKVF